MFVFFLLVLSSFFLQKSWPMHHRSVSTNYPWLPHNVDPLNHPTPSEYDGMKLQPLGNVEERYNHYMNGCIAKYGGSGKGTRCLENEKDRWEMSLRQPQSMKNYTAMGFTKIRAPDRVFELLKEFWDKNHHLAKPEKWYPANIYTYVFVCLLPFYAFFGHTYF